MTEEEHGLRERSAWRVSASRIYEERGSVSRRENGATRVAFRRSARRAHSVLWMNCIKPNLLLKWRAVTERQLVSRALPQRHTGPRALIAPPSAESRPSSGECHHAPRLSCRARRRWGRHSRCPPRVGNRGSASGTLRWAHGTTPSCQRPGSDTEPPACSRRRARA